MGDEILQKDDASSVKEAPEPKNASVPAKRRISRDEWRTLVRLAAPDWPLMMGAFAALSIAASGDAVLPALQGAALNAYLGLNADASSGFQAALARLGLVGATSTARDAVVRLLVVGSVTTVFTAFRGLLFWICGSRIVARLRAMVFSSLLRQPQAFHDEQGPGELSSRLATDCAKVGDVLTLNVNILVRELMQAIFSISVVVRINARLAGLVLAGVALRLVWSKFYAKVSRRLAKAQQDALAASSGVAEQCMSLIKLVRSHGNEAYEDVRYGTQLKRLLDLEIREGMYYATSIIINSGLRLTMLAGVLILGGSLVVNGVLPREALTTFVLYVNFISDASSAVTDQWSRVQDAFGSATNVFDYLVPRPLDSAMSNASIVAAPPTPSTTRANLTEHHESGDVVSAANRGALTFESVDFAYPSRPNSPVFEKFSLSVRPGERVAIVGGSGSGKSTIFLLALRFYKPVGGEVTLDGVPVDRIDDPKLRSSIAWVQQEPALFPNTTVRENIAYGLNDIPDEDIEAAAREANAHEFIQELPQGFDTRIGASGASLSGGQKQRVALARALVRNPALLLLDEATSALDPMSERLVVDAIRRASKRRTVLFTTHKVSQAQDADRIIVMSHGKVVEEGTHDDLLRCNGAYAALLRAGDNVSEEEATNVVDNSDSSQCEM